MKIFALGDCNLNSQPLRALGDLGTQSGFTLPAGCDIGTAGEDRTKSLHAFTLWFREFSAGTTDGRRFRNVTDAILPCHSVVGTGEQGHKYSQTLGFTTKFALAEVQICPESVACPQPGIWQRASTLEDVLKRAQAAATSRESLSFSI